MKNAAVGGNRTAEPAELGRCAASGTLYHPFGLEPRYHRLDPTSAPTRRVQGCRIVTEVMGCAAVVRSTFAGYFGSG